MVSIIARPTNKVREIVPAASGCRAIASIAAATERPSAKAGPIEPIETATAAAMMLTSFKSMESPSFFVDRCDRRTDEDRGEDREDVGLDEADQDLEDHEGDRHEQTGERHHQADHELAAHHVAEQPHHERERAGDLGDQLE